MSDETQIYIITDEEIAEFIALTLAATGGEWQFGHHLCENLAEAEEWAVTMLRQRPERFDLQLVVTTIEGEEVSPAFCGNGYNAENNAKYISWASPSNIRIILLAMQQDRERLTALTARAAGLVAAWHELTDRMEDETGNMPADRDATVDEIMEQVRLLKDQLEFVRETVNIANEDDSLARRAPVTPPTQGAGWGGYGAT